jgi:hypothetical protein
MSIRLTVVTLGALLWAASTGLAQCQSGQTAKEGKSGCGSQKVAGKECTPNKLCPTGSGELAGGKCTIPAMLIKVGDQTVQCCEKARELAQGDESKIQYVVGEKTFSKKQEALEAYAQLLDDYFAELTTVRFCVGENRMQCPASAEDVARREGGKVEFALASFRFASKEAAEKAAAEAREAAAQVKMKMVVAGKEYCCATMAKQAAEKNNCQVEYVVGETKACGREEAEIALRRARIMAAAEVLHKIVQDGGKVAQAGT